MKTLRSFSIPIQAHLLRARLEGAGIPAYLRDENMVTLDWLAALAIGGVKVEVSDDDYLRALEYLATDTKGGGDGETVADPGP